MVSKFSTNLLKVLSAAGMEGSASLSYHILAKLAPRPSLILFKVVVTLSSFEE